MLTVKRVQMLFCISIFDEYLNKLWETRSESITESENFRGDKPLLLINYTQGNIRWVKEKSRHRI